MMCWHPSALAVAAAMGVVLLGPGEGHAATGAAAVTLEYSAVSGCPDAGRFRATVVNRLGYEVFTENAPSRVLVRIISRGQTFEGRMEWRDTEGNWAGDRTFPALSSDCGDLARAMAFTLALQLQLSAFPNAPDGPTPAETEPTTKAPPSRPAAPAQARPSVPVAEPMPRSGPGPLLALGAGTLIGFGMSSSAVPFARILGSVAWPHWSLSVATEASLPTTIRRADGAGFSHHELLASVAGCGNLESLSACLLVKAGRIWATGKDIDDPASPNGPLLQTGLRAGATLGVLPRTYISASAEVLVVPILWSVTLDRSVVWTSPRFAGTLGLDLVFRFE